MGGSLITYNNIEGWPFIFFEKTTHLCMFSSLLLVFYRKNDCSENVGISRNDHCSPTNNQKIVSTIFREILSEQNYVVNLRLIILYLSKKFLLKTKMFQQSCKGPVLNRYIF